MSNLTKAIAIIAWLSLLLIVSLFLTPTGELFLKGVTNGYEGAFGRLLYAALTSLLLSIISIILGLTAFVSKAGNRSKLLLVFSVGPLLSLIAFIMFLTL